MCNLSPWYVAHHENRLFILTGGHRDHLYVAHRGDNLVIEYLKTGFKKTLAWVRIMKKTGGQKSRDTLPLSI